MKRSIRKSPREGLGKAGKGKRQGELISAAGQPRATTQRCPYNEQSLLEPLPPLHGKPQGVAQRKAKKNPSRCQAMKQFKDFHGSRVPFGHRTLICLIP